MSNRHSNKKLQRAIRSRMEATGERYRAARTAVLRALGGLSTAEVDLIHMRWLGRPAAIAIVGVPGGPGPLAYYVCGVSPAGPLPIPLHARAGLGGRVSR